MSSKNKTAGGVRGREGRKVARAESRDCSNCQLPLPLQVLQACLKFSLSHSACTWTGELPIFFFFCQVKRSPGVDLLALREQLPWDFGTFHGRNLGSAASSGVLASARKGREFTSPPFSKDSCNSCCWSFSSSAPACAAWSSTTATEAEPGILGYLLSW